MPKFTLYTYTVSALYPQPSGEWHTELIDDGIKSHRAALSAANRWLDAGKCTRLSPLWNSRPGHGAYRSMPFSGERAGVVTITRVERETR